ncbi:MAG: DNA-3-methyladenine glycosylase [bacterium]|nr:DNA-3-methyladenine glycosylase [bacterium]
MGLRQEFFDRPVLEVARDLLGCELVVDGRARVRIVEVEAYGGEDDPASHAGRGPTPRSRLMFGPPGFAYVYLIYGVHHCLNFVTGPDATAGAVLVRAAEPLSGVVPRPGLALEQTCAGPGRLCRALGVDLAWNGVPVAEDLPGPDRLRLETGRTPRRITASPRIGIRLAVHRLWRFHDRESSGLSRR